MELDLGKIWDVLVESSRRRASTPTSAARSEGRRPLLLREPRTVWIPGKARRLGEIDPSLRTAIRDCVRGEGRWPLFIHGEPGRGKTCAALCLLDHAGGLYVSATGLTEWANAAAFGRLSWATLNLDNSGSPDPTRFWAALAGTPLVVLDDLGARERVSDSHYDAVKRLLDEREGRPLVALSNMSLAALGPLYDDRIASRLAAGTVLTLAGKDRRLETP